MKTDSKNRGRIRPIHKRIAMHTSSLLLLLGGGFLPMPVQGFGQTYTVDVTAKVSAAIPTEPAIITSPHDGEHVTNPTITVTGSCPDNTYVKVFNGSQLAGVASCSGGVFSVQVTLAPGANSIRSQVYNFTDDPGPSSPAITVYYDPPVPPSPSPSSPSPTSGSANTGPSGPGPLAVDIPYTFAVKDTGDFWEWNVLISGGVAPYEITIDWGDGTIEHFTRTDRSLFTIRHAYGHQGTYQPLVRIVDANGDVTSLQLLAEVREKPTPIIQFMQSIIGDTFSNLGPWLTWPIYILIVGGIGVFWAFEISAFRSHLIHKSHIKRHHA